MSVGFYSKVYSRNGVYTEQRNKLGRRKKQHVATDSPQVRVWNVVKIKKEACLKPRPENVDFLLA